jgi:hypothetical protein
MNISLAWLYDYMLYPVFVRLLIIFYFKTKSFLAKSAR